MGVNLMASYVIPAIGQRLKESGAINQSLLTLSNVIRKLSECPPEG